MNGRSSKHYGTAYQDRSRKGIFVNLQSYYSISRLKQKDIFIIYKVITSDTSIHYCFIRCPFFYKFILFHIHGVNMFINFVYMFDVFYKAKRHICNVFYKAKRHICNFTKLLQHIKIESKRHIYNFTKLLLVIH